MAKTDITVSGGFLASNDLEQYQSGCYTAFRRSVKRAHAVVDLLDRSAECRMALVTV